MNIFEYLTHILIGIGLGLAALAVLSHHLVKRTR